MDKNIKEVFDKIETAIKARQFGNQRYMESPECSLDEIEAISNINAGYSNSIELIKMLRKDFEKKGK